MKIPENIWQAYVDIENFALKNKLEILYPLMQKVGNTLESLES